MSKYIYPAVFTKEDTGYSIHFPDIEGCYTQGKDLTDGLVMANDALCLMLYHMEEAQNTIPKPSDPLSLAVDENAFVTLISCDTAEYKRYNERRAVRKTLTIPAWLNTMAVQDGINFSRVLQEALKEQLKIHDR